MADPITFEYTERDYINASMLHWRDALFGKNFMRLLLFMGVFGGLIFNIADYLGRNHPVGAGELAAITGTVALASMLAIVVIALLNGAFFVPRIARRGFRETKEYQTPWTFTAGEEKVEIRNARGEARLPYSDFVKWSENSKCFLLYRSGRQFNLIPRQHLPEAMRNTLVARLQEAGVPRAGFWNS